MSGLGIGKSMNCDGVSNQHEKQKIRGLTPEEIKAVSGLDRMKTLTKIQCPPEGSGVPVLVGL